MLEACEVSVTRSGRRILDRLSLAVAPGEVVAVIGPNGAGKSTAFKALSGELPDLAGAVRMDGVPVAEMRAGTLARRRAVLPQASDLFFPFTASEVVRLGAEAGGAPATQQMMLSLTALERVGMAAFAGRMVPSLSGGEAQRVHLARALAQIDAMAPDVPRYLLLDEPTSSLDLQHQILTMRLAREVAARGVGVLAILHDINLAVMVAHRIVALRDGRVLAAGAPADIVDDALILTLYGTAIPVRGVPEAPLPFILPQMVGR